MRTPVVVYADGVLVEEPFSITTRSIAINRRIYSGDEARIELLTGGFPRFFKKQVIQSEPYYDGKTMKYRIIIELEDEI